MNYQQLIESGVAQWNQWRIQNPSQMTDLRGLHLTHSYLFGINLTKYQPTTTRQFVQLVADHLPADQVEVFSRKVLS